MACFSFVNYIVRETNLANAVFLFVERFSLDSGIPLYSDGFSHTDSYNNDGIVHYIF